MLDHPPQTYDAAGANPWNFIFIFEIPWKQNTRRFFKISKFHRTHSDQSATMSVLKIRLYFNEIYCIFYLSPIPDGQEPEDSEVGGTLLLRLLCWDNFFWSEDNDDDVGGWIELESESDIRLRTWLLRKVLRGAGGGGNAGFPGQ